MQCLGWLCMTSHLSFPSMYKSKLKVPSENKVMGLIHRRSLVYPCLSFFLSLTLFFRLIPWSIEALCVHFPAWASKTWTGRRSASSLPREIRRVPVAYVNKARPLSWGFISFLCKPRNISFYSFLYHSFISFIHSPTSSILRVSQDSAEAGPQ